MAKSGEADSHCGLYMDGGSSHCGFNHCVFLPKTTVPRYEYAVPVVVLLLSCLYYVPVGAAGRYISLLLIELHRSTRGRSMQSLPVQLY